MVLGFVEIHGNFEAVFIAFLSLLEGGEVPFRRIHGLFVGLEFVPEYVDGAGLVCSRHLIEWKQSIHV